MSDSTDKPSWKPKKPSFTHRSYPAGNAPTLILDATEAGLNLKGPLAFDHDVDIYAETVTLQGSLRINNTGDANKLSSGKRLGLFVHTLNVNPSETTPAAILDVSGEQSLKQSANQIGKKEPGSDGCGGGRLELFVQNLEQIDQEILLLTAEGSTGAAGNNPGPKAIDDSPAAADKKEDAKKPVVIGGKGGTGGNGGSVAVVFGNQLSGLLAEIKAAISSPSESLLITVLETAASAEEVYPGKGFSMVFKQLNAAIEAGSLPSVKKALSLMVKILGGIGVSLESKFLSVITVQGGFYGTGGTGEDNIRQPNGANGAVGPKPVVDYMCPIPKLMCRHSIPIAHPDQCSMVLQAAKMKYFIGGEERNTCMMMLEKLHSRISFAHCVEEGDPLYEAYQAAEPRMRILPRKKSHSGTLPSIAYLRDIDHEVTSMMRRISLGLDFYSHTAQWVPRGSARFYKDITDALLASLEKTEEAYYKAAEQATAEEALHLQLNAFKASSKASIAQAKSLIEEYKDTLEKTVVSIAALDYQISENKKALLEAISQQTQRLERCLPDPDLNWDDLVSVIEVVVVAGPEALPMPLAHLGVKAVAGAGIPDNDGTKADKKLLIQAWTKSAANAKALKQGYTRCLEESKDGQVEIQDSDAEKLIVQKDEMVEFLKQYTNALGREGLNDVEAKFQLHIDGVLNRNKFLLAYNATIEGWSNKLQEIYYHQTRLASLSDESLVNHVGDYPAISLFMERAYTDALWNLLETLYLAQRAAHYCSLSKKDFIGDALADKPDSLLDASVIRIVRDDILVHYRNAVNMIGKSPQKFMGEKQNIRYQLSPMQLKELKNKKRLVFQLPASRQGKKGNIFDRKGSVRLHRVRFYVDGASTSSGRLDLNVKHLGNETIVAPARPDHEQKTPDTVFEFLHAPYEFMFSYDLADGTILVDGDVGPPPHMTDSDRDKFALLGPFATWEIVLPKISNPGLDLKNVTQAWMDFYGEFHSFPV